MQDKEYFWSNKPWTNVSTSISSICTFFRLPWLPW